MKNRNRSMIRNVMQKKYLLFLAFLAAAFWILLAYYKTGIFFETNDDRYISEILSGTLTGTPEAHTTHVNYLPLSNANIKARLYRPNTRYI